VLGVVLKICVALGVALGDALDVAAAVGVVLGVGAAHASALVAPGGDERPAAHDVAAMDPKGQK